MTKVQFHGEHVLLNHKPNILYGGEFQYFRVPSSTWKSSLKALKEAGLNFIACYIPWIWHEIDEGIFDFSGETLPERDLLRFLKLCRRLNFPVIVRPGPYIYAEYQGFGVPEWLRRKYPDVLIRLEDGSNGREVSLNHPLFISYTRSWFKSLLVILRPLIKSGQIIAWQLDNETGLPQYGGVTSCGDFNPHTIQFYQQYLKEHYPNIQHLNTTWGSHYSDFSDISPPYKNNATLIQVRQWAEFIEDYIVDYLRHLQGILDELQVACFTYMNDPYLCQWPNQSSKKAQIGAVGFDIYSKVTPDPETIHDIPFSISYAPELYQSLNPGRILIGAEIGAGWFDPRFRVRPEATLQMVMMSLFRGNKMISYYLLQDCIEPDGTPWLFQAPLDKAGKPTDRYPVIQKVGHFLKKYGSSLGRSEELHSAVAVLKYSPQGWDLLRCTQTVWTALDTMDNALIHFGGAPGITGALLESGYNPVIHDLESITPEEIRKFRVIFFASTDSLDHKSYQKLYDFVIQGGTLIAFGHPVSTNLAGIPYELNPLFPARPYGINNKIQYGTNTVLSQVAVDMVDYQRLRRTIEHKRSLNTLDMIHPFAEMAKHVGKTGVWLTTDRGGEVWGSRFTTFWQGSGLHPLLHHPNGTVGYSSRLKGGKVIFLGTLPGLFFDTGAYYTIEPRKKQSVLHFITTLLKEAGVRPFVEPLPNIETVLRKDGHDLLVGMLNRGADTPVRLSLNIYHPFSEVETMFNSHPEESSLHKAAYHHLEGFLAKDAVMLCRLKH